MYEYKVFKIRGIEYSLEKALSDFGKDGWRLHTVFLLGKHVSYSHEVVMERFVPQEAQNETQPMGMK